MSHVFKLSVREKFFAIMVIAFFLGTTFIAFANATPDDAISSLQGKLDHFREEAKKIRNDIDASKKAVNVDTQLIEELLAKYESCLKMSETTIGTDEFDAIMEEKCLPQRKELTVLYENLLEQVNETKQRTQSTADSKNNFENEKRRCEKDYARDKKNIEKYLAKTRKSGLDEQTVRAASDEINAHYNKACVTLLSEMKKALDNGDMTTYGNISSEFDDSISGFSGSINLYMSTFTEQVNAIESSKAGSRALKQQSKDLGLMKKALEKSKKTYARIAKKYVTSDIQKSALVLFDEYIQQTNNLLAKTNELMKRAKGSTSDDSFMDDVQEAKDEFAEFQQTGVHAIGFMLRDLTSIDDDIRKVRTKELEQLKKESKNDPELMGTLNDIMSQLKELLKQAWTTAISNPTETIETIQSIRDLAPDWVYTIDDWRESHGQ